MAFSKKTFFGYHGTQKFLHPQLNFCEKNETFCWCSTQNPKAFFWEPLIRKTVLKLLEELKMRRLDVWVVKFGPAEVSVTSQKLTIFRIFWLFSAPTRDPKNRFFWKISQQTNMVFFRIFWCSMPTWCFFYFFGTFFCFFMRFSAQYWAPMR